MEIVLDYRRSDATALLERMVALLGCYQFALGHELPNRLVVMQGFARLLGEERGAALDAEGRALLDRLATSAQRAHEQALRVAEIGRLCREIEAEEGRSATGLGEVVREAIAEVNVLCGGQVLDFQRQEKMPTLPVSRRALHAVLVQLLRNAAQAAAPGRAPRIEIGATVSPEGTEVWVRDNGRGLSEEQGKRLLGPFRPHNVSGGSGGLALGLFLVTQVVARWGAALRICSGPEQGTTVTLLFPPGQASKGAR